MNKVFCYCEYEFPQDIKDLYFGLPGTAILKIFLDQYIQETDSPDAKVLKDTTYDDSAIYKWNGFKFAFSIQFLNKDIMNEWSDSRASFVSWLSDTQDITVAYSEYGDKPKDIDIKDFTEHMKFWSTKKYFFEDIPESRGMDPRNLITGVPHLFSSKS